MMLRDFDLHKSILFDEPDNKFKNNVTEAVEKGLLALVDWRGLTPLHVASREGFLFKTMILISAGALDLPSNPSKLPDEEYSEKESLDAKKSPLSLAYERGNVQVATLLLACGDRGAEEEQKGIRNHPNYLEFLKGFLYSAIRSCDIIVLEKLITHLKTLPENRVQPLAGAINGLITLAAQLNFNPNDSVAELLKIIKDYHSNEIRTALYWVAYHNNKTLYNILRSHKGANEFSTLRLLYDEKKFEIFNWCYNLLSDENKKNYENDARTITSPPALENLSELQAKIYCVSDKANHSALTDFCDEKNAGKVLMHARKENNYVVINTILNLNLKAKLLFIATDYDIGILTLFSYGHTSLQKIAGIIPDNVVAIFISNLWSIKGICQAIFQKRDSTLFERMKNLLLHNSLPISDTVEREEKHLSANIDIEKEMINAWHLHIQDRSITDLRRLIANNSNIQSIMPKNKEPFLLIGNDASVKVLQYLKIEDIKAITRTSKQLYSLVNRIHSQRPKLLLIKEKQEEIKQVNTCLHTIEDELKTKGYWSHNYTAWMWSILFSASIITIGVTSNSIDKEGVDDTNLYLLIGSLFLIPLSLLNVFWFATSSYANNNRRYAYRAAGLAANAADEWKHYDRVSEECFSILNCSNAIYPTINQYQLNLNPGSTAEEVIRGLKTLRQRLEEELRILELSTPYSLTLFAAPEPTAHAAIDVMPPDEKPVEPTEASDNENSLRMKLPKK